MFEATEAQIKEWKSKYGDVFEVLVEDKKCYLRKPDRKILGLATSVGQKNPMKFNEIILHNCWLAGDEEIKTDDDYFLGVGAKLETLIQIKEAEIKKL